MRLVARFPRARVVAGGRARVLGLRRGAVFTLEAPEGVRFLARRRVFTDVEADML